jgi:NADH-quinone oxidoreductase subunit N
VSTPPSVDWFALAPVLAMLGGSAIALLSAVLVPTRLRKPVAAGAVFVGFAVALVLAIVLFDRSPGSETVIADALFRDRWAGIGQVLVAACGLLAVLVSYGERWREDYVGEYYALLAAAAAGMAFFVEASNLMTIFLGLEWFSIALYILCAIDIDLVGSLEAGLKYLVVGSVGSATLLFGMAFVYGATGQLELSAISYASESGDAFMVLGLAMVLVGLAFKASAAPFHMWTPDAYQGSPTPVTAFMSAATKVAALLVAYRILVTAFPSEEELWSWALVAIVCASLALGNIAALAQRNVKRLLAYSSVSNAGFMLIPVAVATDLGAQALVFYLIPYSAMSIGAFAVVAARERELGAPVTFSNLAGFGWERPLYGVAMWTFMLGFIGFPLTGGFVAKFYVFAAAYDRGWWWMVVIGVVASMVSAAYYLAVVRAMFMRDSVELQLAPAGGSPPRDLALGTAVVACLAVTVVSFFAVRPLIDVAEKAAAALPL